MGRPDRKQLVGPLVQVGDPQPELVRVDHVLVTIIAQREGVFEDPAGGVRNACLPRHGVADQLAGPPEQMRMAGLMLGAGEPPVGRQPSRSSTPE